jgi:hypothetical protein
MKPIDFVVFDGDSSPNTPVEKIAKAMKKPIVIQGEHTKYTILSYYYHDGRMYLDIEEKGSN